MPAYDLRGTMAAIVAQVMGLVSLAVVVLNPFAVNLLHFLPTVSLMEKIVRDIDSCDGETHAYLLRKNSASTNREPGTVIPQGNPNNNWGTENPG